MSALNLASACDLGYKNSKNQRLHVEMTLLKLSHVMAALSIPQLVEDLKKKD
jgi:DNA polymerase-3 subunit gamma/tau